MHILSAPSRHLAFPHNPRRYWSDRQNLAPIFPLPLYAHLNSPPQIDTTSYDNKYRTFYQGARADLTSSASFFGMMLDGVTPLQGSAHYKGLAVQYSDRDGIEEGTSTFDANFQDRRLSGRINVGRREITIGSMLIGNTFSGFGKDAGKSDGLLSFEGAFFGKDASEIAGTYQKASLDDGYIGAFGAQRQ